MSRMRIISTVLLVLVFLSTQANAHVDRIFLINADGLIADIPEEFGKVRLTIQNLGAENALVRLHTGESGTTLPTCVSRLIKSRTLADVVVSGSWYHDMGTLPPYLTVRFFKPGYNRNATFNSHQEFMFNLRDGKLIYGRRFDATRSGGQYRALRLPSSCRMEVSDSGTKSLQLTGLSVSSMSA